MNRHALSGELMSCEGTLPELLIELNRVCLRASYASSEHRASLAATLLGLVPDRVAALGLLSAFGQTRWPASFGQSPYDEVMTVLRHALTGNGLASGGGEGERDLHRTLLSRFAPPAALARWSLNRDQLELRYPRLLRAMRHAALLTHGEAEGALWLLLRRHPTSRNLAPPSSEAVAHFGGNLKAVAAARRWRQRFANTRLPALA